MSGAVLAAALAWATLLLAAGGLVLLRSGSLLQRLVTLDLLAALAIALLALLSYLRHASYYLDAALALAVLSFVSTLAVARYYGRGGRL